MKAKERNALDGLIQSLNGRRPHESGKLYPDVMSEKRYWSTPASACFMGNAVDSDLVPFLKYLNSHPWLVTTSCCSGHDEKDAYVSVAVKTNAMKRFVTLLNRLQGHLDAQDAFLSCDLTFESDVATSCDFENFADWLMFHLDVYRDDENQKTDAEFWQRLASQFARKTAQASVR